MTSEKSQVERQSATGDRSADPHRPADCALGHTPHAHCVCGLAMAVEAEMCTLCRSEGLVLDQVVTEDLVARWDGRRYPSRRLFRPVRVPVARYDDLLQIILAPARRVKDPLSTEEAA